MPTHCAMSQPQLSLPRCRASEASTFRTSDREIPNSRAIRGGAIPALKAARTAFTWPRVSERTATCAGRTLEDSFLFRDPLGVGSSNALAARPDGSVPRRLASSSAASRSDASSPSSSCLSALGRSFQSRRFCSPWWIEELSPNLGDGRNRAAAGLACGRHGVPACAVEGPGSVLQDYLGQPEHALDNGSQRPLYGPPLAEAPDRAEQETEPQGDRKRCERTLTNRVLERAHLRLDLAKGFAAGHAETVRHLSRQPGNVVPHRLQVALDILDCARSLGDGTLLIGHEKLPRLQHFRNAAKARKFLPR